MAFNGGQCFGPFWIRDNEVRGRFVIRTAPRLAYIHVPFWKYCCGHCDLAVAANRDDLVGAYPEAIAIKLSWLGRPREVDTLYFGGGAQSHWEARPLRRLGWYGAPLAVGT